MNHVCTQFLQPPSTSPLCVSYILLSTLFSSPICYSLLWVKTKFQISVKQGIKLIQLSNNCLDIQPATLSPTKVVISCYLRHIQLQRANFCVYIFGINRDIINEIFLNITKYKFEVILTVRRRYYVEIKYQLDATDYIYCRLYCLLNMFRAPSSPSSDAREYYTDGRCLWYLVLWFSGCGYGVELKVLCPVCGLQQQPANWTHNPQLHTIPTT